MKEPTSDQCRDKEEWTDSEGFRYLAFFWPQMGGYSAKAIAVAEKEPDNCVKVFIWHDGEFPFTEGERDFENKTKSPAVLHICDFVDWLVTVGRLADFQRSVRREESLS